MQSPRNQAISSMMRIFSMQKLVLQIEVEEIGRKMFLNGINVTISEKQVDQGILPGARKDSL
jgi:hypothetical protein